MKFFITYPGRAHYYLRKSLIALYTPFLIKNIFDRNNMQTKLCSFVRRREGETISKEMNLTELRNRTVHSLIVIITGILSENDDVVIIALFIMLSR